MLNSLLAAYDAQLREEAETSDFEDVRRDGPLWVARLGSSGFVTYKTLARVAAADLDPLIARTVASFKNDPTITDFEWKTRGHDEPSNLGEMLATHGLAPEGSETVLAGRIDGLVGNTAPPAGVELHRAGDLGDLQTDVERICELHSAVFGPTPSMVELTLHRLSNPNVQLWFAQADGEVIGTGRLEIVPGTDFAGLWGGAIRADWRRRGVYRALTQARAVEARGHGARYLYADCTEMSRVILEACGLVPITTTVPYVWRRR